MCSSFFKDFFAKLFIRFNTYILQSDVVLYYIVREALCAVVDKRLNRIEYRYDSHTMIEITNLYTMRMRGVRGR